MIGESIEKEKSSIDNKVLKKFSGMVRSKLSKTMQIRRVPVIQFRFVCLAKVILSVPIDLP